MTWTKAAFYTAQSLLTQTTNQRFREFIFTLAGDWQGSSLQISLIPRTVFISRDRGFADRSPMLLSGKSAGPKALGLGSCF